MQPVPPVLPVQPVSPWFELLISDPAIVVIFYKEKKFKFDNFINIRLFSRTSILPDGRSYFSVSCGIWFCKKMQQCARTSRDMILPAAQWARTPRRTILPDGRSNFSVSCGIWFCKKMQPNGPAHRGGLSCRMGAVIFPLVAGYDSAKKMQHNVPAHRGGLSCRMGAVIFPLVAGYDSAKKCSTMCPHTAEDYPAGWAQ